MGQGNPEHGVDAALFATSHLAQLVIAHTQWFDPRPPQPPDPAPPTGEAEGEGEGD